LRDNAPGSFDDVWCVVGVDEFDLGPAVQIAGVGDAVERAQRLAARGREHQTNPASGVWALTAGYAEWACTGILGTDSPPDIDGL
jgi:hypothetical protein